MNEWQIINVNILKNQSLTQQEIIRTLLQNYEKYEGLIYPVSATKIVMLTRLGFVHNYTYMKEEIEEKLPSHSCRVMMRKMSAAGLKKTQIDLMEWGKGITLSEKLYGQRHSRNENILLVEDVDKFIRHAMKKMLTASGTVIEAENSTDVMSRYLDVNRDMVFLDIHMPEKTGI